LVELVIRPKVTDVAILIVLEQGWKSRCHFSVLELIT